MNGWHYEFKTVAFVDGDGALQERVNETIGGYTLAVWLSGALRKKGIEVTDPWHEDHGCDFDIAHQNKKYLCVCSIEEDGAKEREAHVGITLNQSIVDRLKGRNKFSSDDELADIVYRTLHECPDIRVLSKA